MATLSKLYKDLGTLLQDQPELEDVVVYTAEESEKLQKNFGFNTAQWAKLLKVERKTIYNWKNNTATRVKAEAAARLEVLRKFSEEFNPKHKEVFSRFLFGRQVDSELLSAFMSSPLVFDKLVDAYDNVYVRLDGMAKRRGELLNNLNN